MRSATYRVQLHARFGFARAGELAHYLDALGVSDLYCSPVLQAAEGSTHGYDVVDHSRISVDLGGEAAFTEMVAGYRARDMGVTVDIVPNHMAIDGRANLWWWDVLENGPSSLYATYFDIDWPGDSSRAEQTVLVPVLGDRYGEVLDRLEIRVEREGGSFTVSYFDRRLPLSPRTQDAILGRAADESGSAELAALAADFGSLPHAALTDPTAVRLRHEQKEVLRDRLAALCRAESEVARAIDKQIEVVNGDPDELDRLLRRQNYRLAYWRTGAEELDYRRFFNIETLVGLRVEHEQVFADTHHTIGRLVRDGRVSGLRVDHVDGLRDPEGYLQRLRRLAPGAYVVVEKVLDPHEQLPGDWPVEGTTGYDFLIRVADVMVDPAGEQPLTDCYTSLTGEPGFYPEVVRSAKLQIMDRELAPEVDRLGRLLHSVCDNHRAQRDRTRREVHEALRAVLAAFPVYRTYAQPDRALRDADAEYVSDAVRGAKEMQPDTDPALLDFIGQLLLLAWPGQEETEFAQLFPQVSAPVMAKGAEDTAFYRYNRLISLNEVGGHPGTFGRPLSDFHADTAASVRRSPTGMLTLATHDTKRSPDVRARISLLSEMPQAWRAAVTRWLEMTDGHTARAGPDVSTRYMFFQTLVGAWPIGADRLLAYMDKATKEAKVHTSWTDPDPDYDAALRSWIEATTSDGHFVSALDEFLAEQRIHEFGRASALAQTALLLTCPGVPDVYQGTETWDNSLVDPDNRRPVDFSGLAALAERAAAWGPDALAGGAIPDEAKLWLTARVLGARRRDPQCFEPGTYEPLRVQGPHAEHLIAFSRGRAVVLVGRLLVALAAGARAGDGGTEWADTTVALPDGEWRALIGARGGPWRGERRVGDLIGRGPAAILVR